MDLYTIIFLIPHNSNRIILDGVTAEVETIQRWISESIVAALDITIKAYFTDKEQLKELEDDILIPDKHIFLYFKDIHPNLIKCRCNNIASDSQKITIYLTGNTTDKEYLDYVTDIANEFNNKVFNIPVPDPGFKKKVHFKEIKKTKIFKRKLTF